MNYLIAQNLVETHNILGHSSTNMVSGWSPPDRALVGRVIAVYRLNKLTPKAINQLCMTHREELERDHVFLDTAPFGNSNDVKVTIREYVF